VNHWHETERILDVVLKNASEEKTSTLARVVQTEGRAHHQPGAKLLVADGRADGSAEAWLHHYETEAFGTPFPLAPDGGKVEVLIQPILPEDAVTVWKAAREHLRRAVPFALVTRLSSPGAGRTAVVTSDGLAAGSLGDADLNRMSILLARARLASGGPSVVVMPRSRLLIEVLRPPSQR
jgi:xanthine/CO dehydrogenase XdhC/CoxF family maturation factor